MGVRAVETSATLKPPVNAGGGAVVSARTWSERPGPQSPAGGARSGLAALPAGGTPLPLASVAWPRALPPFGSASSLTGLVAVSPCRLLGLGTTVAGKWHDPTMFHHTNIFIPAVVSYKSRLQLPICQPHKHNNTMTGPYTTLKLARRDCNAAQMRPPSLPRHRRPRTLEYHTLGR